MADEVAINHSSRQTTNAEPPVIDLQRLSVTFGGRPILRELNGELRGRAIGLLGPNGAGKTTLIHTLLGFHAPSSGTAHIFGRDIRADANQIKSLIGYMPERDSFIAKMSCVHFVRFMAELSGLAAGRGTRTRARSAFLCRPGRSALSKCRYVLARHEAAGETCAGDRAWAETDLSRRADERAGSAGAPAHDQDDSRDSRQRPGATSFCRRICCATSKSAAKKS